MLLAACDDVAETGEDADLLITGGVVIHPDRKTAPRIEDIVIANGKIIAAGPDLDDRYNAKKIYDAQGRYIIPGLADMHSHFGNGILASGEDDTTEVLGRHLFFGNTTILNLGSSQAWPDRIDDLRARMNAGELSGPRLLAVGSLMTMTGSHPTTTIYSAELQDKIAEIVAQAPEDGPIDLAPLRATTLVDTPDDVRTEVARVAAWGADAIKLTVESGPSKFGDNHPQMTPAMIAAAVEMAAPYESPVLCHISSLDELEACLTGGAAGVVHVVTPEEGELPDDLEQRMVDEGFIVIPTAAMFEGWAKYADNMDLLSEPPLDAVLSESERGWLSAPVMKEMFGSTPEWNATLDRVRTHLKKFNDLGGVIIAGTDTGNPYRFAGYALHEEIAFYVSAGLSEREALATATTNAARLVGEEGEWGAIKPGLVADLVVLEKNPLDDIANTLSIIEVVRNGRIVDRTSLPLN